MRRTSFISGPLRRLVWAAGSSMEMAQRIEGLVETKEETSMLSSQNVFIGGRKEQEENNDRAKKD